MTTDFVIDVESNRGTVSVAWAVKKHRDLEDPCIEKLDWKIYWERRVLIGDYHGIEITMRQWQQNIASSSSSSNGGQNEPPR